MIMESFCGNQEKYIDYLKECINAESNSKISCPYFDPDGTHISGKNSCFYMKLVSFLNKREIALTEKLNEMWSFCMNGPVKGNKTPSGIEICTKRESIMYLRSDLFGFSAPQRINNKPRAWDNRYPYAAYLSVSKTETKYQNVAEWIWNTRTVGGSFVWPIQKTGSWQSVYNRERGVNCYIQDRVDLTLSEVMHYYEHIGKYTVFVKEKYDWQHDVLYAELNRNPNMIMWLDHFGSFETFVEFFMFDDFVCKVEAGKLMPKNIEIGEPLTEEYVNGVKSQGGVIQNFDPETIKNMLDNVMNWTLARSRKIEKLLEAEKNIENHT